MNEETAPKTRPNLVTEEVGVPQQVQAPVAPNTEAAVRVDPHEPGSHVNIPGNKINKPNSAWKFFFLVPAFMIIGTIAVVAYLTRTDFVVRNPVQTAPPSTEEVTTIPTLPPQVLKKKIYKGDLFEFEYLTKYDLIECGSSVYLLHSDDNAAESFCTDPSVEVYAMSFSDNLIDVENDLVTRTEEITIDSFLAEKIILDNGEQVIRVVFEEEFLEFKLKDSKSKSDFEEIIKSIKILFNITTNWEEFKNTEFGYSFKYPSDWDLDFEEGKDGEIKGSRTVLRKNAFEFKLQNLTIDIQVGLENAALTASDAASSSRSLAGWDSLPERQIRSIAGVNAQIIKGEFEGNWSEYAVVWFKDKVFEITWTDNAEQDNQKIFDEVLESFKVF